MTTPSSLNSGPVPGDSIHQHQIRSLIGDTLKAMGDKFSSPAAVELLYNTGIVESQYHYIRQYPSGPARSFWQLETHSVIDNIVNYLKFRGKLKKACAGASFTDVSLWRLPTTEAQKSSWTAIWEKIVESNMRAAIVHARLIYWRSPAPLPKLNAEEMGEYWVKYYNRGGKGTIEKFVKILNEYRS